MSDETPLTDEQMDAIAAEMGMRRMRPVDSTQRPNFGRLQQLDREDNYRLTVNGDLVAGLTWSHLHRWTLLQDEYNRQFPEHALTWVPDRVHSASERKFIYNTEKDKYGVRRQIGPGSDEWGAILVDLLHDIEHIESFDAATPREQGLAIFKGWVRTAKRLPQNGRMLWRDKERGHEADFCFTSEEAIAAIQRAGIDLRRGEILEMLRQLGGTSQVMHVPGSRPPMKVRAYRLSERRLKRLKAVRLPDPADDYVPGVQMSEIGV